MFTPADLQVRPSRISGMGLFAQRAIPAGTRVLEYVGQRITEAEAGARADKTFLFNLGNGFVIDGLSGWNPAGFINHSCDPNCTYRIREGHVWLVARRNIHAGEELAYNYGLELMDFLGRPCFCHAPRCIGFVVAERYHPLLRWFRENQPGVRPPVCVP